jgi:D-arabinose 1-dehydrogenase-like Zn-dependent alcohol dehydrogenase
MRSQAITAFGQPLEEIVREAPVPQGAEVLLRVTHCGVCHSDVHIHDGHFDMGGGNKLDMTRGIPLPFTMGHEIEGEVVAVGPEAREAKPGDRRVAFPWIGCGRCAVCARGDEHLCAAPRQLGVNIPGGYADHVLVPHEKYLLDYTGIPDGLAATYMCSGLTAYSALRKIGQPGPDDAVLIVGVGGVGMMGLQFARALFGRAPLVADISADKLAAARQAGAGAAYDAADPQVVRQIKADTGGGVFAAIDFVGSESSFALARNSLRKGGTAVVVGLFGGAFAMPIPMLPFTSMQLKGSFVGSLAETREMLEMVRRGAVDPIPVAERPLEQATATLDDLRAGRIVGRVVLRP